MNKSDSIVNLAVALIKCQSELKNPPFDSVNPHFKNRYASLAGTRDMLTPTLAKHDLAALQLLGSRDTGITCETVLMHKSGEWLSETLYMPATKLDAQGFGSAITYARRYALMAICGVVGDEDDDAEGSISKPKESTAPIHGKTGVLESLPAKRQKVILDTAVLIKDKLAENMPMDALGLAEASGFDAEEKIALWGLLDSKQRSMLKRVQDTDLGSQP